MKRIKTWGLVGLMTFSLGCGLKASDVLAPPTVIPDYCKDAYVYKLGIYPNVTSALEVGAIAVLAAVEGSADPMIVACKEAKEYIALGSVKLAFDKFAALMTKNNKYAPAALFAISQIQDRFKDLVLTQCDKDTLCAMFDRIMGYAQASKADKS